MERENFKSYLIGISYSVASVLVGYSHTLALLFRSSIEASKKQPRVWLEYGCSMAEVLLYLPFSVPLVFLMCSYRDSEGVRYIHGCCADVTRMLHATSMQVFRKRFGDVMEMVRSSHGDIMEEYLSNNICLQVNGIGIKSLYAYLHKAMSLYSYQWYKIN